MDTHTASHSLTDTVSALDWFLAYPGRPDDAPTAALSAPAPRPTPDGYKRLATGALVKPVKPCTCPTKVPGSIGTVCKTGVGLLSYPEKLPCPAFGLPAGPACPFMVTGVGKICEHCYAKKGRYVFKTVQAAAWARFNWVTECLRRGADGVNEFVELMVKTIRKECARLHTRYFRWMHSGDVFSPAFARAIRAVVEATPEIIHWIPTRSYRGPKILSELILINLLPNVTVRPSALDFDAPAPVIPGLAAGTGARRTGFNCPAHFQDNACGDCRVCFEDSDTEVFYRSH